MDNAKSIDGILRYKTQNFVYNIQMLVKLHKKQMLSLETKNILEKFFFNEKSFITP